MHGHRFVRRALLGAVGLVAFAFAVLPVGMSYVTRATATFSNHTPPPNLKGLVKQVAPRPLLLMYSGYGQGGEIELNPVFHRAAGPSSALWMIPGARHMGGLRAQPAEYERRVIAFFDTNLKGV